MSNPEKNFSPVNEFIARGVVLTRGQDERGDLTVKVVVHGRRKTVILNLYLEGTAGKGIHTRQYVKVKGYTRAYSYRNESLKKESEVMYFVATEIVPDISDLQARFNVVGGNFYGEAYFRAFVAGKITKVEQQGDRWGTLTIVTCGSEMDSRPSYIPVSYLIGSRLPVFDYQVGDIVCIQASAHSPERKQRGQVIKNSGGYALLYQNLLVEDIAYLHKQPRETDGVPADPFPNTLPNDTRTVNKSLHPRKRVPRNRRAEEGAPITPEKNMELAKEEAAIVRESFSDDSDPFASLLDNDEVEIGGGREGTGYPDEAELPAPFVDYDSISHLDDAE